MKIVNFVSIRVLTGFTITALSGGLIGCSVATPPALLEARNSFEQTSGNASIRTNAPVALRDAEQTLNRAEREWQQSRDQEETEHLAYLARQQVEIAKRVASRELAQKDVERLREDRQTVLLEAREREVMRTREAAEARAQDAEKARKEALAAEARAKEARETAAVQAREAEAARKRAEAEAAKSRELEASLQALQAKVKETDRGIVLTLGDVLFEFDRAELRAGALRNLYPLVSFLKDNPLRSVIIEGHTDSVGSDAYNLDLSRRRADAVRLFLTDNGIVQDRVTSRGLGEGYPVAANNTDAGRQMNRRVEITIEKER